MSTGSADEQRARLARLPAKHLVELFEELATRLGRGDQPPLPRLTLDVGPRTIERCELLAVKQDRDAMTLLVTGADGFGGMDVTYVPVATVRALTVHATHETLHHLGFGALRPRSAEAPPSPLELKRRALAIGEELGALLAHPIAFTLEAALLAGDQETLVDASDVLKNLRSALLTVSADDEGKAALAKIERVELCAGRATTALVEGAALRVTVAAQQGALEVLPLDALITKVESAL